MFVKKSSTTNFEGSTLPDWTSEPELGCEASEEICASGEGATAKTADAHALNSLAAIFETKVTSEFSHYQVSKQDQQFLGDVQESSSNMVKNEVDQLLEGIRFKKRFKQAGIHYVLASLDKRAVGTKLKNKINDLDAELESLWKTKQRTSYRLILSKYFSRQQLADRLTLLQEGKKSSPVELKEILNWFSFKVKPESIQLVGEIPDWMRDHLKVLLTEAKFQLVSDSHNQLKCSLEKKQEFIKVSGFSKWSFLLTINHKDNDKTVGTLSERYIATGRSKEDAELKIKENIIKDMETKINSLHLD